VGTSRAPVRLASDPERPVVVHFLDARKSHGVYLGVVVDAVGADAVVFDPKTPAIAPRFARAGKDVLEAAAEVLRARQHLQARLLETVPIGVLHIDALGRVLDTNDRLHDILGCPRAATLDEQLATLEDEDRQRVRSAIDAVLREGVDDDLDVAVGASRADSADGDEGLGSTQGGADVEVRLYTLALRALTNDDGDVTGAVVGVSEVADHTAGAGTRDGPHLRATFDVLTRCHNRSSTMAALEAILAGAGDGSSPAAIFVDLDNFKKLNEGQGHDAGDEFLGVVARRLHGAVREDDIVGRIGGDEFLVVCPGIATAAEAVRTAIRVAEALSHEIQLKDIKIGSRASIGVAWSSGSEVDADGLVDRAETAMHESKRRGAGRPVLFTPSLLSPPPEPG
jgi:diguanylate cyclase (GGDEF)-like protein